MAIGTKSMPSARLRLLKVKRSAPVKVSRPTVAISSPMHAAMMALSLWLFPHGRDQQDAEDSEGGVLGRAEVEREAGHDRREDRQADDRDRAADEGPDGGDAQRGAGLALLGECKPSKTVTTDDASPGSRSSTEVMVPPYWAP